jgi:hypothetical protein
VGLHYTRNDSSEKNEGIGDEVYSYGMQKKPQLQLQEMYHSMPSRNAQYKKHTEATGT